jgi:RNA polymerase sigma-70 factor (ECF subfamily)
MTESDQKEAAAFIEDAGPYLDELRESARHHLAYHEARGDVDAGELTPDEVVGETLIRAFGGRKNRPADLPLRSWLLSVEARTLDEILGQEQEERDLWAFSLDEPLPARYAEEAPDRFWDWGEPDDTRGEAAPASLSEAPSTQEAAHRLAARLKALQPAQWQAWLLFDTHRLSLAHVASAVRETVSRAAHHIREARALLKSRPGGKRDD